MSTNNPDLFEAAEMPLPASAKPKPNLDSGLLDNYSRGTVVSFLKQKITDGSDLSIVSAYFTIYAYDCLSRELHGIERLRFLFGEPRFISAMDPDKTDRKAFHIEDQKIALTNRLQQKQIARDKRESRNSISQEKSPIARKNVSHRSRPRKRATGHNR
jgi:hypothetical protein